MAIIEETAESKTWNRDALMATVRKVGGFVGAHQVDDKGPLFYYEHPLTGQSADEYRSEALACNALCEALRDLLISEFPIERRAA